VTRLRGARSAQVDSAKEAYLQTIANYRQTVLTAFQHVEDQRAAIRVLSAQLKIQDKAVVDCIMTQWRLIGRQRGCGQKRYRYGSPFPLPHSPRGSWFLVRQCCAQVRRCMAKQRLSLEAQPSRQPA
jgi:citrate lyase gamma subunit